MRKHYFKFKTAIPYSHMVSASKNKILDMNTLLLLVDWLCTLWYSGIILRPWTVWYYSSFFAFISRGLRYFNCYLSSALNITQYSRICLLSVRVFSFFSGSCACFQLIFLQKTLICSKFCLNKVIFLLWIVHYMIKKYFRFYFFLLSFSINFPFYWNVKRDFLDLRV